MSAGAVAGEILAADSCCPGCGGARARPLFQADDRLYHTTPKSFQVVECVDCRLVRLYPNPSGDELRSYYPDSYWYTADSQGDRADRLAEAYRRLVLGDHIRFVRRALERAEEGPVLDTGCGGGLFLRLLRPQRRAIVGLDFSAGAASIAWHTNSVPAVCASLTDAPFAPSSFGAITMFHVLEHLANPASYLQASHRLLKPGGRLVVQVPNADCWQFLLFGENWSGIDVPRHLVNFKASDMESLLDHCGFEVVRRKFFSLRDNPAGLATTLAPSLDPMARRIRRLDESGASKLAKDAAYFGLVLLSLPFTLLEAACAAGSTVMLEARKKP
jgi:SAM-dependent methyltransferase